MEVAPNYTGKYQRVQGQDSIFQELPLPLDRIMVGGADNRRSALFEVVVRVEEDDHADSGGFFFQFCCFDNRSQSSDLVVEDPSNVYLTSFTSIVI